MRDAQAEWDAVLIKVAHRLAGDVYPQQLLIDVWRIARRAEWQGLATGAPGERRERRGSEQR